MSQIEEDLAFISAVIATSGYPKCIGPWGRICDYIKESQKPAHNNARDEILLCALTGVKCGNRVRVCKLKFGSCSGQRKTSPVV